MKRRSVSLLEGLSTRLRCEARLASSIAARIGATVGVRRRPGDPAPADPHEEKFLAFGRVFCGVLRQVSPRIYCFAGIRKLPVCAMTAARAACSSSVLPAVCLLTLMHVHVYEACSLRGDMQRVRCRGPAAGDKPSPRSDHPRHVRQGAALHVLSAAYSPASPDEHRLEATAEALYLMMGRGLERLPVGSHICHLSSDGCFLP